MTNERMDLYEGGLDTTYLTVYDIDDLATLVVTFFPDTDNEIQLEMTMEEFYDRVYQIDENSIKGDLEDTFEED